MENRVLLIGDIVKLGQTRTLTNGWKVFEFVLRTWTRGIDGQVHSEYHPITLWGDAIEKSRHILEIGKIVRVDGSLSHTVWEDQYHQKKRKTSIRGLLLKEHLLGIPEITEQEKEKFLS